MKTVSVYIPTHNRPAFLDRALSSLANQDAPGFQVLVCDDGSTRENKKKINEVIHKYKAFFSDFIFFSNENPSGACHARNMMINAADGEFITGLDDDDEFSSNRLRSFLESDEIDKYPFLSSGLVINDGKRLSPTIQASGEITLNKLLYSNVVGNQIFIKTDLLKMAGGFDENFPSWQDYELWVRLTNTLGSSYKIQECTYILNIDHELGRITNSSKVTEGYVKFIEKFKPLLSQGHLNSLEIQNIINSSATPNLKLLIKNFGTRPAISLINYWIKKNLPAAHNLIKRDPPDKKTNT